MKVTQVTKDLLNVIKHLQGTTKGVSFTHNHLCKWIYISFTPLETEYKQIDSIDLFTRYGKNIECIVYNQKYIAVSIIYN